MAHIVLGVGYCVDEHITVRDEWRKYNVDFQFVDTVEEAAYWIKREEYVCVTAFADQIGNDELVYLRSMKAPPIVLLTPGCSVSQRAVYLHRGAADFILHSNQMQAARSSGKDDIQYYLDAQSKCEEPLTIITIGDLYFCLEYRSVEVRGQSIDLTAKEFDILALLITHPKRVFTFDLIMDLVWGNEYTYYSRKTLRNHVSNLRNKLKVQPDIPNYIVSVNSVGFKFDPTAW